MLRFVKDRLPVRRATHKREEAHVPDRGGRISQENGFPDPYFHIAVETAFTRGNPRIAHSRRKHGARIAPLIKSPEALLRGDRGRHVIVVS